MPPDSQGLLLFEILKRLVVKRFFFRYESNYHVRSFKLHLSILHVLSKPLRLTLRTQIAQSSNSPLSQIHLHTWWIRYRSSVIPPVWSSSKFIFHYFFDLLCFSFYLCISQTITVVEIRRLELNAAHWALILSSAQYKCTLYWAVLNISVHHSWWIQNFISLIFSSDRLTRFKISRIQDLNSKLRISDKCFYYQALKWLPQNFSVILSNWQFTWIYNLWNFVYSHTATHLGTY